ncbi:pyridoxamine 5'-phosphate oxidase family protein [Microbacterium sp. RU33B]|uniref:pyridoxamine 5'-phosphate oxidase family protein n=1 Tax=Microbacterium sp. RU33B TaxID=1907390 RepID=UPI00096217D8|nr:pyridoxamine 5'-phosphate oxidase family protein [Microbacterium sp. RU33B]SIT89822.1 PPOX class probable F420-dependent enzyme, Rv3369 family [Microbacterium sp. RU33B]
MTFRLDASDPRHARALELLADREIGWLGTNGRDGYPHAVPVWFVWHDEAVITFSQPHAAKARNLRADRRAMLQLETSADGEEWLVLQGDAELLSEPTAVWMERVREQYLAKYTAGLDALGWSLQRLVDDFSLVIALRPHRLIGL